MKNQLSAFLPARVSSVASSHGDCAIGPGGYQARTAPIDCQSGHCWTLSGSGIAHRVAGDPICSDRASNH